MNEYITPVEFRDFQINQERLIEVLNHNMSDIRKDIRFLKNVFSKKMEEFSIVVKDVAEIKGSLKVTSKIVWWILGIITVIVVAAAFG